MLALHIPPPLPSPSHHHVAAYRYKLDLLALANCKQQHPQPLPPFLTSITTPLNIAAWVRELENHPTRNLHNICYKAYLKASGLSLITLQTSQAHLI